MWVTLDWRGKRRRIGHWMQVMVAGGQVDPKAEGAYVGSLTNGWSPGAQLFSRVASGGLASLAGGV
jgi:hypothetical protein